MLRRKAIVYGEELGFTRIREHGNATNGALSVEGNETTAVEVYDCGGGADDVLALDVDDGD